MSINGLYRIAAAVPVLHLGDPVGNALEISALFNSAIQQNVSVLVCPELCLTGASCGDLLGNDTLIECAYKALHGLKDATRGTSTALVVGLPVKIGFRVYNCAALLCNGQILGLIAKQFLSPAERRVFTSAAEYDGEPAIGLDSTVISTNSVFDFFSNLRLGIVIGTDAKAIISPVSDMVLAGAQLILNPSASPESAISRITRVEDIKAYSRHTNTAYVFVSSGCGESSADSLYCGQSIIAISGKQVYQNDTENKLSMADFLPRWIDTERSKSIEFQGQSTCETISIGTPLTTSETPDFLYLPKLPYAVEDKAELAQECDEILRIQATALARRVKATFSKRLVLGVSGGLDSTVALLVCAKCCDLLGLDHKFILALTMPGMGTSNRTKNNALDLAAAIGADMREIDIRPAVTQHFNDIGHDISVMNVVYENAQARERTQILMDLANEENGLLVGTGDLSEIAMGWCTYNGDHMSMYSVNGNLPKSMMRVMVDYVASVSPAPLAECLKDINATPISPELVPGKQHTESIIGNYDIHDFFIYHFLKHNESPEGLKALAGWAFKDSYSPEKIEETCKIFIRRFFTQQFKRNAMPDGPKLFDVALDSRVSWQMPSDMSAATWK